MNGTLSSRLPTAGLAFGEYPQRRPRTRWPLAQAALRTLLSTVSRPHSAAMPADVRVAFEARAARLRTADAATLAQSIALARGRLRRDGLTAAAVGAALAAASEVMARTLGKRPYPTQLLAAWLMLDGQLIEMSTGEGKTLATALAAAVAALGGAPVQVLTANDYLVERDCAQQRPYFAALGLGCACVTAALDRDARRRAWRHEVVYSTARELAFDYLRDHAELRGERDAAVLRAQAIAAADGEVSAQPSDAAVLPGLTLCVIDEADSILLDEAVLPLILAAPSAAIDDDGYRRAFTLSGALQRQRDYRLLPGERRAVLTEAGRARVEQAVQGAGGVLRPARRACELVESALAARLLFRRGEQYAVVDGTLQLIDELTGRIADGRRWSGALHSMVEIKEGLEPSPPSETSAQITYQRFFPRYLRLCGLSGTVLEARHELRVLYDLPVRRVPLAKPSRFDWQGERCFAEAGRKWEATVEAIRLAALRGQPVLVGTDSVADSEQLSARLAAGGIAHQVLNATQDADEAQRIARAGRPGAVTVATNIAGRGTDIAVDATAKAAGGLHVIATMRNRARRIDRQLLGRAARHGDPGSGERLLSLEDTLVTTHLAQPLITLARVLARRNGGVLSAALGSALFDLAQGLAERGDRARRAALRGAAHQNDELYGFAGGTE